MESDKDLRQSLRSADRAEAAPWIDYPTTPAWYPLFMGTWGAVFTAVLAFVEGFAFFAALAALIAVGVCFNVWYRRLRGTMPTGKPPVEFRRPALALGLGYALTIAVAGGMATWGLPWLSVAVVLVGITSVTWWYEGAYARAAERTRTRLA